MGNSKKAQRKHRKEQAMASWWGTKAGMRTRRNAPSTLEIVGSCYAGMRARRNAAGTLEIVGSCFFLMDGLWDLVPAQRPGGPPVYRQRGNTAPTAAWMYLGMNNRWVMALRNNVRNNKNTSSVVSYYDTSVMSNTNIYPYDTSIPSTQKKQVVFSYSSVVPQGTLPQEVSSKPGGMWFSQNYGNEVKLPPSVKMSETSDTVIAAQWNTAAVRAANVLKIAGATGDDVIWMNGMWELLPGERKAGGAPVYRQRNGDGDADDVRCWLYFAQNNQWTIGCSTKDKNARAELLFRVMSGVSSRVSSVVPQGTLPDEVASTVGGCWQVFRRRDGASNTGENTAGDVVCETQTSVTVTDAEIPTRARLFDSLLEAARVAAFRLRNIDPAGWADLILTRFYSILTLCLVCVACCLVEVLYQGGGTLSHGIEPGGRIDNILTFIICIGGALALCLVGSLIRDISPF